MERRVHLMVKDELAESNRMRRRAAEPRVKRAKGEEETGRVTLEMVKGEWGGRRRGKARCRNGATEEERW